MRLCILLVVILSSSGAFAKPKTAYLDVEDGQVVSVFNAPGKNWKNCNANDACSAVGWPDNTANIKVMSPKKKLKVVSPYTGELTDEEYVLIEYSYSRTVDTAKCKPEDKKCKPEFKTYPQRGQGWIDAAFLTDKKKKGFFTEKTSENTAPKKDKENCGISPKDPVAQITPPDLRKSPNNQSVKSAAAEIMPLIGHCAIDPNNKSPTYKSGNAYDNYVLGKIMSKKVPLLAKQGEKPDGKTSNPDSESRLMNAQDLVDIDALARTMYGEMAGCFKHGLQYPITVSRIAKNRAQSGRDAEFIKGPHHPKKNNLSKVVTTASQFNVWMPTHGDAPNNSLKLALCPPSDATKASWQGHKPTQYELEIWENAVLIATETVLFPQKFKDRTSKVTEFHYTSGRGKFYNMKQVFPWIEDRKVSKNACVEVWREQQKRRS